MDSALATSILAAAKEHGVFKEDMPETDEARVDKAARIVRQAEAAERAMSAKAPPAVGAILGIARANGSGAATAVAEPLVSDTSEAEAPAQEAVPAVPDHDEPPFEPDPEPAPDQKPVPMNLMSSPRGGLNTSIPEGGDKWECALCEYACRTERGLKMHANRQHDGEIDRVFTPQSADELRASLEPAPLTQEDIAASQEAAEQVADTTLEAPTEEGVTDVPLPDPPSEPLYVPQPFAAPNPETTPLHDAIKYVHTERALQKIDAMKLPKPQEFEGDPPVRPSDVTILSVEALRKLYSQFNACSAYARYHCALEESQADDCKRIYNRKKAQVMASLDALDGKGKPKPVTMLENEAHNSSEDLRGWADKQAEHLATAKILRAMLESYDLDCTRLSREMAMRMTDPSSPS